MSSAFFGSSRGILNSSSLISIDIFRSSIDIFRSWVILGRLGAVSGLFLAVLGSSWGRLRAVLGDLGAILGLMTRPATCVQTSISGLGSSWGHLGAMLERSWGQAVVLGLSGPSCGHLGSVLGSSSVHFRSANRVKIDLKPELRCFHVFGFFPLISKEIS